MKITKQQLKQIIKEELGGDYGVAMQMINKFNNQTHFGDVEADLQEDEDGTILYRVVISMGTKEIENLGSQVGLERNIQSKINQLQSELSTRVDVFGDTIQIELQPKVQGIENLQSFLNDASLLSHEIVGGDVAQSDLPGVKESKLKITKEQLKRIIKEEIENVLRTTTLTFGDQSKYLKKAANPEVDVLEFESTEGEKFIFNGKEVFTVEGDEEVTGEFDEDEIAKLKLDWSGK